MKRPYIKRTAPKIIELAPQLIKKQDYLNLETLEYEIGFRKKAAKRLAPTLEIIKNALKNKNINSTPSSKKEEQPPSSKTIRQTKRRDEPNKNEEGIAQLAPDDQEDAIDLTQLPEINEENRGPATTAVYTIRPSGPDLLDTPQSWEPKFLEMFC